MSRTQGRFLLVIGLITLVGMVSFALYALANNNPDGFIMMVILMALVAWLAPKGMGR